MIETTFQLFITGWLDFFVNPQKRVFWLYLLTAFGIGFIYLYAKKRSLPSTVKQLFDHSSWWSASAKADYKILILNSLLMVVLSPRLLSKSVIAFAVFHGLIEWIPEQAFLQGVLNTWQISLLFTASLFIIDDFFRYWIHRWLHTVTFLWPFHRVHHTATGLNFFTVFRTHPVEAVLFSLRSAVVQGGMVGLFFFLFGDQVSLLMVLGANMFNFAFNLLGSNLRHSPVALPYPNWLERYLMSPAQHHIHHSAAIEHRDTNFGVVFSCWDRWFGSFCHSTNDAELRYGLHQEADQTEHQLYQIYLAPFLVAFKRLLATEVGR